MTRAKPELQEVALRAKESAGGGLLRVTLDAPEELESSYERPGQYIVVRAREKTAYLVLAGDPGDARWQLIVRPGGEAVDAILDVAPGEPVGVSAALGAGFPMVEARGQELIMIVTGSGIAAGRPVIRARVREGEGKSTELLLGVRTLADVPMAAELADWSAAGVKVTVCLSREEPPVGASYAAGYVQDAAKRHARAAPVARRLIFAAGVKPMIDAVRALARDLGVHEEDVRTNY